MLNLTNTLNVFIEATVMKTTEAAASVASNVATALKYTQQKKLLHKTNLHDT